MLLKLSGGVKQKTDGTSFQPGCNENPVPAPAEFSSATDSLQFQKVLLDFDSGIISPQLPARLDNSVAGDENRDRIVLVGQPNGTAPARAIHFACDVNIRSCFSIWYQCELLPDPTLKRGALALDPEEPKK
jgi:hypothetical protein